MVLFIGICMLLHGISIGYPGEAPSGTSTVCDIQVGSGVTSVCDIQGRPIPRESRLDPERGNVSAEDGGGFRGGAGSGERGGDGADVPAPVSILRSGSARPPQSLRGDGQAGGDGGAATAQTAGVNGLLSRVWYPRTTKRHPPTHSSPSRQKSWCARAPTQQTITFTRRN